MNKKSIKYVINKTTYIVGNEIKISLNCNILVLYYYILVLYYDMLILLYYIVLCLTSLLIHVYVKLQLYSISRRDSSFYLIPAWCYM